MNLTPCGNCGAPTMLDSRYCSAISEDTFVALGANQRENRKPSPRGRLEFQKRVFCTMTWSKCCSEPGGLACAKMEAKCAVLNAASV